MGARNLRYDTRVSEAKYWDRIVPTSTNKQTVGDEDSLQIYKFMPLVSHRFRDRQNVYYALNATGTGTELSKEFKCEARTLAPGRYKKYSKPKSDKSKLAISSMASEMVVIGP